MKRIGFYDIRHTVVLLWIALSGVCMVGCSSDDDEGGDSGSDTTSPYWPLGTDNTNMPSSGTVIAQYSDAPVGSDIGKLVDGDVSTKYLTYHNVFEITWNGNSNVAVKSYSLTSAPDSPEMDPKSWKLSGSLDGKSWKVIDEQSNQVFSQRKETKTYSIDNTVTYRYYKLSVLDNQGNKATQIAEWVLSADTFTGNIDDLMAYATGYTQSGKTPMGTQHENGATASEEDLQWLKDASKEPDNFGNLTWSYFSVSSLYPFGIPKPADVNQHLIGDCCACAVMSSMAYLYPGYIKDMIRANSDNTEFVVTLYDPKGKKVEVGVSNSFVADGSKVGAASGKNDQVTWATVLEKAVMKWKQVYAGTSDIGGIATEYVAAIFVGNGNSFAFNPNVLSAEELERVVSVSLQQGKMVVGGFKESDLPVNNTYKTVNYHAYSFHLSNDASVLFTMRNPWGLLPLVSGGYSDGKEDGLLPIKNDGVIPPSIDLRIMEAGAAEGYATKGKVEAYNPPSYTPAPMRIASSVLNVGKYTTSETLNKK